MFWGYASYHHYPHSPPPPTPPAINNLTVAKETALKLLLPYHCRPWKQWTWGSRSFMPFSLTWKDVLKPSDTLQGGQTKYRAGPSPQVSQHRPLRPIWGLLGAPSSHSSRRPLQSTPWFFLLGHPSQAQQRNSTLLILNFTFEIELKITSLWNRQDLELTPLWVSGASGFLVFLLLES